MTEEVSIINDKTNEVESILDQTGSEILVFGCIRLWYLSHFPEVLCHLVVHYYGITFLWTINGPNADEFKSKPFIINNITFQTYFSPNATITIRDPDDNFHEKSVTVVKLSTKILSMPNTIRTCTAYYQYNIFKQTFRSRHTYSLAGSRAHLPKQYMKGLKNVNALYPIQILISIEPIRIHHWSYDNVIDYQQDILMREYIEFQWRFKLMNDKEKECGYLQSNTFGNVWCLDLDLQKNELYLKLLRLAPNVTRISVECKLQSINWKSQYVYDEELEFRFTNDGISHLLKLQGGRSKNRKYETEKDTVFVIEVRIIGVYRIDENKADDFEFGMNDKQISIDKWRQYGIV